MGKKNPYPDLLDLLLILNSSRKSTCYLRRKQKTMKRKAISAAFCAAIVFTLSITQACDHFGGDGDGNGKSGLVFHFSGTFGELTKASISIPDTSDFLLEVNDQDGKSVYDGLFGDSPETLFVSPGTYTVSVRSGEFKGPAFNEPLFGDDECVVVPSGGISDVTLTCSQINSGLRLAFYDTFVKAFPKAFTYVSSSGRSLLYKYTEERVAYCDAGPVSVLMEDENGASTLFTKSLSPKEILTVRISAPDGAGTVGKSDIKIDVDTTRNWTQDDWKMGGGDEGDEEKEDDKDDGGDDGWEDAVDVAKARSMASSEPEDVWVYGYIVGCFKSSSRMTTGSPFDNDTNIAIASRRSVTSATSCIAVFLPKGEMRDALNLVDNPSLEGAKIWLKGNLVEKYYGVTGLKSLSAYHMED